MTLKEEEAYYIDRLDPISTGVCVPLWISCECSDRIPQVKAEENGISFSVAIADQKLLSGEDKYYHISTVALIQLKMWVRLNRQALLDYWEQKIGTMTFLCLMSRLPEHTVDISVVNLNETRIFPKEKYKVQIRSCDSSIPHFHVISKEEGYEIRLTVSTGKLLYCDQYGTRTRNDKKDIGEIFIDVVKAAKEWLELEPAHPKSRKGFKTNRELLEYMWEANHAYYTE